MTACVTLGILEKSSDKLTFSKGSVTRVTKAHSSHKMALKLASPALPIGTVQHLLQRAKTRAYLALPIAPALLVATF
jgi:hypothetical protein